MVEKKKNVSFYKRKKKEKCQFLLYVGRCKGKTDICQFFFFFLFSMNLFLIIIAFFYTAGLALCIASEIVGSSFPWIAIIILWLSSSLRLT